MNVADTSKRSWVERVFKNNADTMRAVFFDALTFIALAVLFNLTSYIIYLILTVGNRGNTEMYLFFLEKPVTFLEMMNTIVVGADVLVLIHFLAKIAIRLMFSVFRTFTDERQKVVT